MAAAGAEKPAAGAAPVPGQQEEEEKETEALFAAKHAELVSEARDVAREHGVAVTTVAFRPDGTAVADEAIGDGGGGGMQEQVRAMIQRAIGRKVSAMESGEELAAHRRELQMLRGIVVGELTKGKVAPGRKEKDDDGEVVVAKRAPGQQKEMDGDAGAGAGFNKIIGRVE